MVGEEQIVREKKTTKKLQGEEPMGKPMAHPWISYIPTQQSWSGWVGNKKGSKNDQGKGGESEYQEKEDDREE